MAAIGYVTRNGNGFKGQLRTLSIRTDVEIIPNSHKNGSTQPDYRVLASGVEIGAGWIRISETSGKDYVSLSLAAPEFGPRRLYANLGRAAGQDDEDAFAIIWNPAD
ncbi:hypothetical protein Sj15T_22310 [Sphingobium sp. TA15]|uniref:DUF736 domain-containing protein n=1 Tax=Sphingobium indicum (strain DSM 16413 / CCM 7287 / MTCC 6362 / UT26 / NBRC 101211 / UT26S) TaxID=452662 RepID=D4Z5D4_SPHIU|nr:MULTISPECIES: DUF736 domain-containing protein [Sphingobium]AJR22751.1 hypothetical protein TZ53_02125 [Sphingobium sp. YBL2]WDA38654.1 DUF736 domain-containing protein [Sphingobium sp. YC-XJ3]BAI97816.1 conserved hypothetical protein [Sphingobium indicum UT26S]BDD67210.1 hypothetical protein Sj15T_22310 [Sphingobium sp. TA15]